MISRAILSFRRNELSDVLVALHLSDDAVAHKGALAGTSPGFLCLNAHRTSFLL
jgi:hypothetical protein